MGEIQKRGSMSIRNTAGKLREVVLYIDGYAQYSFIICVGFHFITKGKLNFTLNKNVRILPLHHKTNTNDREAYLFVSNKEKIKSPGRLKTAKGNV